MTNNARNVLTQLLRTILHTTQVYNSTTKFISELVNYITKERAIRLFDMLDINYMLYNTGGRKVSLYLLIGSQNLREAAP